MRLGWRYWKWSLGSIFVLLAPFALLGRGSLYVVEWAELLLLAVAAFALVSWGVWVARSAVSVRGERLRRG